MQVDPEYRDAYTGAGELALLCEGDVLGYEATALRRWCDARVDVWPCGTKTAIHGMSDAIGRARPVVVVEDRDFRAPEQARRDCDRTKKERERQRGISIAAWRCWRRNEIENYLLHPDICEPILVDWFGCTSGDVRQALAEVLSALAVHQAAQFAFAHAGDVWRRNAPDETLRDRVECRPRWDDGSRHLTGADAQAVAQRLAANAADWKCVGAAASGAGDPTVSFGLAYAEWREIPVGSAVWRMDWAGKEVLKYLRMLLAARFGWYDDGGKRVPVDWRSVGGRAKQDTRDRRMERELRPNLVAALLSWLNADGPDEDRHEWRAIAQDCESALPT